VRVLISVVGAVPMGTSVRLADGRTGIAVGAGPDPFRPQVLVDGMIVKPTAPVVLHV
jgi:hypothetical protein